MPDNPTPNYREFAYQQTLKRQDVMDDAREAAVGAFALGVMYEAADSGLFRAASLPYRPHPDEAWDATWRNAYDRETARILARVFGFHAKAS